MAEKAEGIGYEHKCPECGGECFCAAGFDNWMNCEHQCDENDFDQEFGDDYRYGDEWA
jgi:hypothetical protein